MEYCTIEIYFPILYSTQILHAVKRILPSIYVNTYNVYIAYLMVQLKFIKKSCKIYKNLKQSLNNNLRQHIFINY